MFLIYCNEDRSYIVEENKAIFEDDVKKDDNIQFFHCNKIYTGCVIGRSDDENELAKLRKQAIEEEKKTAKISKPVHDIKLKKRQGVPNVPYLPPLPANKKTKCLKKANNKTVFNNGKDKENKTAYYCIIFFLRTFFR